MTRGNVPPSTGSGACEAEGAGGASAVADGLELEPIVYGTYG
jgi:hypothetical protein